MAVAEGQKLEEETKEEELELMVFSISPVPIHLASL